MAHEADRASSEAEQTPAKLSGGTQKGVTELLAVLPPLNVRKTSFELLRRAGLDAAGSPTCW